MTESNLQMPDPSPDPFEDEVGGDNRRLLDPTIGPSETTGRALRPEKLEDFIGQDELKENLSIFIGAARDRGEALDHVLFFGPPGLGKTTLAQIVARELGVGFRATSGPVIGKAGDLAALLTNLQPRDVLFIDEIHRLNSAVEEILYPAMEDYSLDLVIGEGPAARSVRIDLPPFTLVGATTRVGMLANPLRDRFGVPLRLNYYESKDLAMILRSMADKLGTILTQDGALEIAARSRGTPRIAGRLLRRIRDVAHFRQADAIDAALADEALRRLDVDSKGLDALDRRYLQILILHHDGGPVGAETLAVALSESRDAIEDVIEPFLVQKGYLARTPRGRVATRLAYQHMKLPFPKEPETSPAAEDLFDENPPA